jgi:murein hydrolase activator
MLKKISCILITAFLLQGASLMAQSQSKKDLQKKKEQLRKDIEFTNKLLNDTKEKRNISLNQLVTLNKKISIREELINTINDEIVEMNRQIAQISIQIDGLSKELIRLKEEYAQMVSYAYKNQGAYKKLMFLFAAKDFNQAYKRLKYLQQYGSFRKKQADRILAKQTELNGKINELMAKRISKRELLGIEEKEKKELDTEKNEQWNLISSLQNREKQLRKDLKEKQRAEENLNKAIEAMIRKEIEESKKKLEAASKKDVAKNNAPKTTTVPAASPEIIKLSQDFESNKGKLPWPVEQGVVTSTFGVHPHPALRGIMINNSGVDIQSTRDANARAIFEGQITGVINIPGSYKAVIVRHGEYRSVYSNLEEVYVKMGDQVTTRQNIGKIHTSEDDSKTEVNLQIWKGENRMDPLDWILHKK